MGIIIGGLFLGFVLYTFMLFGGAITALPLFHSRATVDATDQGHRGREFDPPREFFSRAKIRPSFGETPGPGYEHSRNGLRVCCRGQRLWRPANRPCPRPLRPSKPCPVFSPGGGGTRFPSGGRDSGGRKPEGSVADNASAVALAPGARKRIESQIDLRTTPQQAAAIREAAWLWSLLDGARILAVQILALDADLRAIEETKS